MSHIYPLQKAYKAQTRHLLTASQTLQPGKDTSTDEPFGYNTKKIGAARAAPIQDSIGI